MQNSRQSGSPHFPAIVIGAGPAGLAVSFELTRLGIAHKILESSGHVGHSWRQMPRGMRLLSPWGSNTLPGRPAKIWRSNRLVRKEFFVRYLMEYAESFEPSIAFDTRVEGVEESGGVFDVHTNRGNYASTYLVNATGYFKNPKIPQFRGLDTFQPPILHFGAIRDIDDVVASLPRGGGGRVLIVGKRISAGFLLQELHARGLSIWISHRSPIEFSNPSWLTMVYGPIYMPFEKLHFALSERKRGLSYPPMPGGKNRYLIEQNEVRLIPEIERFEGSNVVFSNGTTLEFELVVLATGFDAVLDHIPENLRNSDRIFLLGTDNFRSFRSRFLRGIREDAQWVAKRIYDHSIRGSC